MGISVCFLVGRLVELISSQPLSHDWKECRQLKMLEHVGAKKNQTNL